MRVPARKLINTLATVILVLLVGVLIWNLGRLIPGGDNPPDEFVFITAPALKDVLDQHQSIVVLDVRSRADYTASHIPSAKNIPYDELETRAPNELDQNDRIVTYCRCQDDSRGDMARQLLTTLGFKNAVFLKGGIQNWEDLKYSTSK